MAFDDQTMHAVYTQYSDQIFRFLAWHTGDSVLAEDLTSEVFLRAWKHRRTFVDDNHKAWLYRVARNLATDHWRKKKPSLLDENQEIIFDYDLHEETARREQLQHITAAVAGMQTEYKSIVTLRLFEQLSYAEISVILGKSEATTRVLYCRALKDLRKRYEKAS